MWFLTIINLLGLVYVIAQLNDLKNRTKQQYPEKAVGTIQTPSMATPVYNTGLSTQVDKNDALTRFAVWFARDWPLKVGALFILLGFVWLLTYAFLHNWIGETGRIVFGILAGSAILAWGASRIKINVYQGEIITALGSGIVLLSIYAAQYIYNSMFPPIVALLLVAAVSVAVGYIAHVSKTIRLATLGLMVGSVAPLLTASQSRDPFGLFSYLFFVIVGTVWLVRKNGWRLLTLLSILIVWFYCLTWFNEYISPSEIITLRFYAVTFTILFYLLSLGGFLYDQIENRIDAYVGVLSGFYTLHWVLTIVPEQFRSFLCVAVAVGYMSGALAIFKAHKTRYPVYLFTSVSILFLVVATLIELEGTVLPIALAAEALALIVFGDYMYGRDSVKYMASLFVLPVVMSLQYLFEIYQYPETALLICINTALYTAAIYLRNYSLSGKKEPLQSAKVLAVVAGVYSLAVISTTFTYYIGQTDPFVAKACILMIYAVVGIGLYVFGVHEGRLWTRRFGLYLTIYVIARLLLVEVWEMQLGPRIITFFAVGTIFIISVFVRKSSHE